MTGVTLLQIALAFTLRLKVRAQIYHKMILIVAFLIALVSMILYKKSPGLNDIPGPKPYPIIGNIVQLYHNKPLISLANFAKQYGGILKIYIFNKPVVVLSDHQFIHEALVKQAADFAGRPQAFRWQLMSWDYSEIIFSDAGPAHHGRRVAVNRYLKQFGSGIQKLENIALTATDDLIANIAEQLGRPLEVKDFLFKCISDVMTILLVGETFGPEISKDIKIILDNDTCINGISGIPLDWFPFLRFSGNKTYKMIMSNRNRAESLVMRWLEKKPSEGFINFVQSMSKQERVNAFLDSRDSQIATVFYFLAPGLLTSSSTLTCLMNVLCHYPDVQKKLREEVMDVIGPARHPTLTGSTLHAIYQGNNS